MMTLPLHWKLGIHRKQVLPGKVVRPVEQLLKAAGVELTDHDLDPVGCPQPQVGAQDVLHIPLITNPAIFNLSVIAQAP